MHVLTRQTLLALTASLFLGLTSCMSFEGRYLAKQEDGSQGRRIDVRIDGVSNMDPRELLARIDKAMLAYSRKGLAADLEQARLDLVACYRGFGYPDGEGFPVLTLMHNTSEGHQKIAQAIASMWQEALGVDVRIENQEWKVYLDTISKKTPVEQMPHVWRLGWCADYPDNNNWVKEVFAPEDGRNDVRWYTDTNEMAARFQEIVDAAQRSQDPEERKALYKEAEKILTDDAAVMAPIYYYTTVALTQPWVTKSTYGEMGGTSWFQWQVDWEAKKAATGK